MTISTRWGNLMDFGFTMVSNILLDSQEELGITDEELLLIIKASRHMEEFKVHDCQLDTSVSEKTLQRRRKSLRDKGYLETTIHKSQGEDGTWHTDGITYDFSNLTLALTELANKISAERTKKEQSFPKTSTQHNNNYNTTQEVSPELGKYCADYKNKYGIDYNLTSAEKLLLRSASLEFIQSIPYIFEYTAHQQELGLMELSFTPRLIFFLKVAFRQEELIAFALDRMAAEQDNAERVKRNLHCESEKKTFYELLNKNNITIDGFIDKLRSIKDSHYIWFKTGAETYDVFNYGINVLGKIL